MDADSVRNGAVTLDPIGVGDGLAEDNAVDATLTGILGGDWGVGWVVDLRSAVPGGAFGAGPSRSLPADGADQPLPLAGADTATRVAAGQLGGGAFDLDLWSAGGSPALAGMAAAAAGAVGPGDAAAPSAAIPAGSPPVAGAGGPLTIGFADAGGSPSASGGETGVVNAAVVTGTYIQLGPSPSSGPKNTVQSGDNPPNGTVTGAVQAIVAKPGDANTIWIGTPDGGIWVTHNGGTSWTPLTDKLASLSIGSLSLDPTDATSNTLIAGIGWTSNGAVGPAFFRGGQLTGLLYSTNGGTSWTSLGSATLAGQSIIGVAARGSTILAAAFDQYQVNDGIGGLFRSTNGGTTITQVTSASGLGTGPVSSLVGDPTNTSKFYAAVTSTTAFASTAVYVSSDTGATWTPVFTAANSGGVISSSGQTFCRVAVNGSEIAVGVVRLNGGNAFNCTLAGLFLSTNSGTTWTSLSVPSINPGGQAFTNFAIALDPTNAGVVYVTGDRLVNSPFTVQAFMVTTTGATSITDSGTQSNSTTHADSRAITFDANGRLLLGTDGGIYARTNPTSTTTGDWSGLNGSNLSIKETYALAFDGNSDRLLIAGQDTGTGFETTPGSGAFTALQGADGINAAANDRISSSTNTALYYSFQSLGGLTRKIVNSSGTTLGTASVSFSQSLASIGFSSSFVLNNIDPSRIVIHTQDIYVTQDTTLSNTSATSDFLTVTDIGSAGNFAVAVSYGTQDNTQAVLAAGDGTIGGKFLFLSIAATPASGTLTAVTAYAGNAPSSVAFDLRTQARFFVADQSNLYGTVNTGTSFTTLTANLTPLNLINPTTVAFISNNGVNELLVGGLDNVANAQSPIAVADSDGSGNLTNWRLFGNGLPNTYAMALNYDVLTDTLAVGTYGRGGWVLYDVTSNFTTAWVLNFGLANNNSSPDASLLTGSRALQKFGTGTLTINGTASYTLGSLIAGGVMQLASGASVSGTIGFTNGTGSLALANDAGFSNTLSFMMVGIGGAKTNFVDIQGHTVTITGVTGRGTPNGTISLSDGTTLNLSGLSSTWFPNTVGDGASGTDVYVSDTACYCRGTLILTAAGDVPVEDLRIGDLVVTASGELRPVKWVGQRGYDGRFVGCNRSLLPIRIVRGALGDEVPARDLWLSPEHALYIDGVLAAARLLVNGATIVQAAWVDALEYFHVELATHDIIFAEGAAAESYVECDNRGMFQNIGEFARLYPDERRLPAQFCALRLGGDAPELAVIRAGLDARARALGHPLPAGDQAERTAA